MDPGAALVALEELLTSLTESPYDIALHAQHIRLAETADGLDPEAASGASSAREMMVQYVAAGDEVWSSLLEEKERSGVETTEGVEQLLKLYELAEVDYLCTYTSQPYRAYI